MSECAGADLAWTSASFLTGGSANVLNSHEAASKKSLRRTDSAAIASTARHCGLLDGSAEVGLPENPEESAGKEVVFVLVELESCFDSDEPIEAPLPLRIKSQ